MKKTLLLLTTVAGLVFSSAAAQAKTVLRIGFFPNVTHVQALVAQAMAREGKPWFEPRLGADVELQWFSYNAGPSATEAIFAKAIDLTYVGPSPAVNAYAKSKGTEIRVIAGAANGGSGLIVQPDENLQTPADFKGKKIATPQLGNTQDISARSWLIAGGLKITQTGGDAMVIPTQNPDQLALFKQKQIDGVWAVEPWMSRLELDGGGKALVEEKDAVITILVSRAGFLKEQPDLAKAFVKAHQELTAWINAHPDEAQKYLVDELTTLTHTKVSPELIAHAWKRITVTDQITAAPFQDFVKKAKDAGFLKVEPDLSSLLAQP
ncbi:MAG: ABC transporter substrate-binding protein [Chthoniobacteraceae bacterium]